MPQLIVCYGSHRRIVAEKAMSTRGRKGRVEKERQEKRCGGLRPFGFGGMGAFLERRDC